ncbi:MAG: RNA polymerase sigma-70 factor [Balneolales bacterium]
MDQITDTVLAKQIKVGNEKAFEAIFDRYHRQLFYLAKKYLKDHELAEDAVQDIFVKLWLKRKTLDASRSIRGFLFVMLKNHLLNVLRDEKQKITSEYPIKEESMPQAGEHYGEATFNDYQKALKPGINELSVIRRNIFEMKVYKGLSNQQIADQLLISVHTVKSHFYHSSRLVRTYLKEHS